MESKCKYAKDVGLARVVTGTTTPEYNNDPPFHPDTGYPELPYTEYSGHSNFPYSLLRDLFHRIGYDGERYGTSRWNPLGTIIQPGQTVLLKPNFVLSFNAGGHDLFSVVTHPSILRALIDYVFVALKGTGRIIIADAPQMDCNWDQLMAALHLDSIQSFYHKKFGFDIEVYDLRNFALKDPTIPAYSSNRESRPGDPLGSVIVNLGERSRFYDLPGQDYYGADYNRSETIRHHHGAVHEYCVSRTVLSADVFISVPKMKVHKKVGVTLNLKGLVGINTNKNYLIHYRLGTPDTGGDQLPDSQPQSDRIFTEARRWLYDHAMARQDRWGDLAYRTSLALYRKLIKPIRRISEESLIRDAGNWHGNDSAWRMTTDLARIITFVDSEGKIHHSAQRRFFCVVDGIIGGEDNGPLSPTAKACGCLVAGENPLAVDLVTTRLMGFDINKLRQFDLMNDDGSHFPSPGEIEVLTDGDELSAEKLFDSRNKDPMFGFKPHPGWVEHIEV
jgi:uncharacterized protein (DUF362 family)